MMDLRIEQSDKSYFISDVSANLKRKDAWILGRCEPLKKNKKSFALYILEFCPNFH